MNRRVAIAVPLYRDRLDPHEKISLDRLFEVLGDTYPIVAFAPEDTSFSYIASLYPKLEFRTLPKNHFDGWQAYSRLMLCAEVYDLFADFDYMIICQTDCFVLEDRIEEFLGLGYDYIGSPWIPARKYRLTALRPMWWLRNRLRQVVSKQKEYRHLIHFRVGNGGFSLRRVAAFRNVAAAQAARIEEWNRTEGKYGEDVFFSTVCNDLLRIPDCKTALGFSFDCHPEEAYKLNAKKLPMAAHAWHYKSRINFWKQFIPVE